MRGTVSNFFTTVFSDICVYQVKKGKIMVVSSLQNFRSTNMCQYKPQFKGQSDVKEVDKGDYIERHIKTNASTGVKCGVGIASLLLAGLGQFINGDIDKGFLFLAANICSSVVGILGMRVNSKLMALGGLAGILTSGIWSTVDAVKNAKSETVQIVSKSNNEQ